MALDFILKFNNPVKGTLKVEGKHTPGEKYYFFDLTTDFVLPPNQSEINSRYRITGDAETGIVDSLLPIPPGFKGNIQEINWHMIEEYLNALGHHELCEKQKQGFMAFSEGKVTIPEVIYMPFEKGDLHLKGAHQDGGDVYALKIATACPQNTQLELSPNQGMMIAFNSSSGEPLLLLKDEGRLTDLRTALSGRIAAQAMMNANQLTGIGVLGTGVQARLQIQQIGSLFPNCRTLTVWGRTKENTEKYARDMAQEGWKVQIAASPREVADKSNLIVTTTPSTKALLTSEDITQADTLIISIGADMPGKIELGSDLLENAGNIIIDSIEQGKDHGNAAVALKDGLLREDDLQELGDMLRNGLKKPEMNKQLRVFLSSGIGVQDLQIVQSVIEGSKLAKEPATDLVPEFSEQKIAELAKELYGIEGKISPLDSFEDQNALITSPLGKFVFKISNKRIPFEDMNSQNCLLTYLKNSSSELCCPEVVPSMEGKLLNRYDGFAIRLFTFIDGNILGGSDRSSTLNYNLGKYLGLFSKTVQDFEYPVMEKPYDYWNLDNVLACKEYIEDISDDKTRELISSFFDHYEENVLPQIPGLRKGVIHGDANEQNFLVGSDDPTVITGLIDFGDLQRASIINDLAIALAYALLGISDIESTAHEIVSGYHSEFPILENEAEILSDLVIMRLITTVTLTSNRAKLYPENTYLLYSQEPARKLLQMLKKKEFNISFGQINFEKPII